MHHIEIHCRTNLDLQPGEQWPRYLPTVPRVGDKIQSGTKWREGRVVELEVVAVTWKPNHDNTKWYPEVELHLPARWPNISAFEAWYDFARGSIEHETYRRRYADATS